MIWCTLCDPKFSTTHGNEASRPTATVTFGMGSPNFGSGFRAERKKIL